MKVSIETSVVDIQQFLAELLFRNQHDRSLLEQALFQQRIITITVRRP